MSRPDLQKEWYSVQDLAKRWDCEISDVWHEVEKEEINPSFLFNKVFCQLIYSTGAYHNAEFSGRFALAWSTSCAPEHIRAMFLNINDAWQADLNGQKFGSYSDSKDVLYPLNPFIVTAKDFLFTPREVARFEAAHPNRDAALKKETGAQLVAIRHAPENDRIDEIVKLLVDIIVGELKEIKEQRRNGTPIIQHINVWNKAKAENDLDEKDRERVLKKVKTDGRLRDLKFHSGAPSTKNGLIMLK